MDIKLSGIDTAALPLHTEPATMSRIAENRELIQAVRTVNGSELLGEDNELSFQFDRESRRPVLRIVNRKTHEVVRQIPPEYVLRVARELRAAGS